MSSSGPLVDRMSGFGTTIFAEMSALAAETGAINLGQGFPDTDGPPRSARGRGRWRSGPGTTSTRPAPGIPELRAAIAAHQLRHYGIELDADDEVLVTTGATEGIAAALLSLCGPGDEVVTFEPYYDSYAACIALAGADPTCGDLAAAALRRSTPTSSRRAITPATKLILLNSPHNPTGKVFDRAELEGVAALCREHDLLAVTDEVYEHLTFDGLEHVPLSTLPGMAERTLTISSARQDVLVHRMEGGLGDRPGPLVDAVKHGEAVPHLRERRPVPVRDRDRPGSARRGRHRTS